jgi:hypothetical protein
VFRRREAKVQSERDQEWRSLVRAVTDPEGQVSEVDERRFRAYLGELGRDPRPAANDPAGGQLGQLM